MAYFTNLFSPDTYKAFSISKRDISGFRETQKGIAKGIMPGDKLICYVTKLSRWVGILEVIEDYFIDDIPIFTEKYDPFIIRFRVKPIIWLDIEDALPIHEDLIWNNLSFTKNQSKKVQLGRVLFEVV